MDDRDLIGRFLMIVPMPAVAAWLAAKKIISDERSGGGRVTSDGSSASTLQSV
ncbi:MAG: hypothetical protein ACREF3_09225 [Acetobacteraceae bacterium]